MKNYIQTILRGLGQVMFQNNAVSGLLFFVGISFSSLILGMAAILGTAISTTTAQLLKYSKYEIEDGIYGFNGALVGVAICFYFGLSPISIGVLVIASFLSTILMKEMKRVIPAFTAPFVLITWLVIVLLLFVFQQPVVAPPLAQSDSLDLFSSISKGFSEVGFQDNIVSGVLFFLALLANSKISAVYALYGSLVGALLALIFSQPFTLVNGGIFGYNAILCAIVLGGAKWRSILWVTLAIFLSVILNIGFAATGIIALTSAFVLATWIVLYIQFIMKRQTRKELKVN